MTDLPPPPAPPVPAAIRKDPALSLESRPQLMMKLRRVGWLFGLLTLVILAAVHWVSGEIGDIVNTHSLSRKAMQGRVEETLGQLNMILVVSGIALTAIMVAAAVLVEWFVRVHFARVEDATRRKSQFVRFVSHEMRTPLNAINGFAQVLAENAEGTLTPGQADCVKEIRTGAGNLKQLINDILDLAKVEAGTVELAPADVPVTAALEAVAQAAAPLAQARRIRLDVTGPAELRARGDAHRIRQVVLNLVSNALKFSPEGSTVEVSAGLRGAEVLVTVADHGAGISPADQATLFEEYRQTAAGRAAAEGTGLGLAICRRLIELMGGRIWVVSAPGHGTRFIFTLPVVGAGAAG